MDPEPLDEVEDVLVSVVDGVVAVCVACRTGVVEEDDVRDVLVDADEVVPVDVTWEVAAAIGAAIANPPVTAAAAPRAEYA